MQTTQLRYIIRVLGRQIGFLLLLPVLGGMQAAQAQDLNKPQYDNQFLHFGFNVALNSAQLQLNRSTYFYTIDTLTNLSATQYPGLGLGAITSFRLGKYFDLRFVFPQITFAQRDLQYDFQVGPDRKIELESAYIQGSALIKYKSKRHRNTRFYLVGGAFFSHDLASTVDQSRSNTKPVVSLVANTYGYEVGFGFDLYYPYFKFAPELKVSNTLNNALYKDPYIYARAINSIYPKMVTLSFNFE